MMMLNAVAARIAIARDAQTLTTTAHHNARLGCDYFAVSDDRGLIAVAMDAAELEALLASAPITVMVGA